jgi:hypothetical protein
MKILLNSSGSAMQFSLRGQDYTLLPRRSAHVSQIQSIYAVVYDDSLDNAALDFVARNVRRRYCVHGTIDSLVGLRPSQVLVVRNGYAAPLESGGVRSAELTLKGIEARIPDLFSGGADAVPVSAPAAPSIDDISSRKPVDTRTPYVFRDGGFFVVQWNQIKPGDTIMIRESTGEYVSIDGSVEFVATSAPYMMDGLWRVDTRPVSPPEPDTTMTVSANQQPENVAVDTSSAGQDSNADDGGDGDGDDDSEGTTSATELSGARLPPLTRPTAKASTARAKERTRKGR